LKKTPKKGKFLLKLSQAKSPRERDTTWNRVGRWRCL